jgi:predicted DNA-binding protein
MEWRTPFEQLAEEHKFGATTFADTVIFIETEIIEKLIEEIPDILLANSTFEGRKSVENGKFKKHLLAKWLGKETL